MIAIPDLQSRSPRSRPPLGLPARPYRARTKGKVERPFRYIGEDFFLAGSFRNLEDLSGQLRHWLDTVANPRVHATTRRVVNEAFAEEGDALKPLPLAPYQAVLRLERRVSHEGMVCMGGNLYSVPDTTRRRVLHIQVLADAIRIFEDGTLVASHAPLEGRGEKRLDPTHRKMLACDDDRAKPVRPRSRGPAIGSSTALSTSMSRGAAPCPGRFAMSAHVATLKPTGATPAVIDRVKRNLVGLKMPRALEILDVTLRGIERGETTAVEALDILLAEELTLRENRRIIRIALQMARLSAIKTLASVPSHKSSLDSRQSRIAVPCLFKMTAMEHSMARQLAPLILSDEERAEKALAGRRKTAQALALRARIVLACADGGQNKEVAAKLGVVEVTVGKWRRRFVQDRLDGLRHEPRPGVPRTIDDARIEATIVKTLESLPKDATHWSSRGMAKESGLSVSSVQRIWRAFGLQPHRIETFKLSTDPDFVAKVRDVVGLYVSPPQHAVVLCVDEKSQIQALDRSQLMLPMRPGQPARRSHDYTRHGTTSLFAAFDIATGKVIGKCYSRHRAAEFRKFLDEIEAAVPRDLDVHLVMDMCGRPRWCKKNLSASSERGRVLTCVRPFAAAVTCRWPVWEFAERVQFNFACSRHVSMIWFSRSRLVDRGAILSD